ncbi:MAG: V-type ATPase subunit [Clostridium sp.]
MKGLLSYSGITTKIKAMEGKLITDEQYKTMATLEHVPDAVAFLKAIPTYRDVFLNLEDDSLHRGTIERLLTDSLYRDYTKLYQFANLNQRKFLDFYFFHFETDILKNCLRNAVAHQPVSLGLARYEDFFNKHSHLNLVQVSASENLDEFIDNLIGTDYYNSLIALKDSGNTDPFNYEMALDLFYFSRTWQLIKKTLPKSQQDAILQCYGTKLDLLNLQWIYRIKRYYTLTPESIQDLLIPLHYKLQSEQLNKLIKAETMDDFFAELSQTWYGSRLTASGLSEKPDLEILYRFVLNHLYQAVSKRNPYSMAILYSYLYFKEREIKKIITIIECIRYNTNVSEIITYIEQH